MRRREFLKQSLGGGVVGAAMFLSPSEGFGKPSPSIGAEDAVIEKVRRAMLSMQRQSWEQGIAAQAFLELRDEKMVYLMAKEMALRQTKEGRLGVVYSDGASVDGVMGAEAVLAASRKYNDPELKKAVDNQMDYLLSKAPRSGNGTLYHRFETPEIWIDSMNTAAPFFAAAGKYKEAMEQIRGICGYLWNAKDKLFSHSWDDGKKTFINKKYWGVGNGWAAYGMTRVIRAMPESMKKDKQELIGYVRDVLESCLTHICSDGLFHNVVDDPGTFIETNLSQILAYTIFRGVRDNWLDKKLLETAQTMRRAAHGKVDEYGFVQGVCGAPFFYAPGRATEGQAFFLLMEAAYKDLNA
jgi:rhamnogalacturonyl hydrolase YesR